MNDFVFNMVDQTYWDKLNQILADTLKLAMKQGATSAEVAASIVVGLNCTVRLGKVEIIEFNRNKQLAVTVYHDKRKGFTSTSDLEPKSIQQIVTTANQIAKYTEADPYNGLADLKHMTQKIPNLDLYHFQDIQPQQAIEIATNCEGAAMKFDKRINNSEGATFTASIAYQVYGNSNGFLAGYPSSLYSLCCAVIGQQHKSMQRDFDYTIARNMQELSTAPIIGQQAAKRTVARLGAVKLKTCKAPVLFHPNVARNLLASFIAAISGANLYRKSSFLLDGLNTKIFSEIINIKEEPFLLRALGSSPFDNEGVAPIPRYLVERGVLQSYVLNSYSARKLGMETTGNAGGVHNLILEPGRYNFNELLQQMGTGLVAMELIGHGVNIVTGDYSKGCVGFWVENGVIQYPVEEITIAGNLKDLFLRILAVGNDLDHRDNIITGSILVEEMTIAGR